jgi:hypothetical protein
VVNYIIAELLIGSHTIRHHDRVHNPVPQGKAIGFSQFLQPIDRFMRSLGEKFHILD